MKKYIKYNFIYVLTGLSLTAYSQSRSGQVIDTRGEPVEYATIILLEADRQVSGAITDSSGFFTLSATDGVYDLRIQNISYKPIQTEIALLPEKSKLGIFQLENALFKIDEIVVTSPPVTREADRFIVRINDQLPAFMNKDVSEILQLAPGVWVDDKGISINGTAGAKVFINDRELKLSSEALINYLRNYRSSDIAKIEVIPQAGAEYSADAKGGIVRITLRKQQENGLSGNGTEQTIFGKYIQNYRPSFTFHTFTGKWRFDSAINGEFSTKNENEMIEKRFTKNKDDAFFESRTNINSKPESLTGRLSVTYEIDSKNSIGAEWEGWAKKIKNPSFSETIGETEHETVHSTSDYHQMEKERNHSATLNYNLKLDTLGSLVKFVFDYMDKKVTGDNNYHSVFDYSSIQSDSIYRNNSTSNYEIYTGDLLLEKYLKNGLKYTTGFRLSRNRVTNKTFYEGKFNTQWYPIETYNYSLDYTEHIGAVYATLSFKVGKIDAVAGLRGEYTRTEGKGSFDKNYMDLFPNLNLTYSFDPMKTWLLVGQYARNIQRPNFWYLNSNRVQYSDYSYMVGNPMLRPTYINRMNLTLVYLYRHTLTIGGNLHKDLIREVTKTDIENQEVKYVIPENHNTENHYFVALSSPLSITQWLTLNTNIVGVRQDIRGTKTDKTMRHYLYFINTTANITLPKDFFFELTYSGTSRLYSANSGIEPNHLFHAQLKKKLFDNRLNVSAGVYNLFDRQTAYFAHMDSYTSSSKGFSAGNTRSIRITLQYNFHSGKTIKKPSGIKPLNSDKKRMERASGVK
ncbi:MAG: outer membrane beta-barrel family protein [Massilibacteroides sp.]|nr:outer membrane beta-barrel family protein [Massilibacteroides sp.]MDD4115182.1 outer membrane beta-barrel family protein [Massilibacteroides sp.]MDD4659064.1 outer membrane beta-barrel family protein [Massilibacteroides sp.]